MIPEGESLSASVEMSNALLIQLESRFRGAEHGRGMSLSDERSHFFVTAAPEANRFQTGTKATAKKCTSEVAEQLSAPP